MSMRQVVRAGLMIGACLWSGIIWAQTPPSNYQDMITARSKFFGAENVDQYTGAVRRDRVIISWVTNASLAASIEGRIVLLDTYINRLEVAPPAGQVDLRRTPFNVSDLVNLHPEAIFLGHGHGDHADNAAYIAKLDNVPIYSSPETCAVMQADIQRMANDPNTANGGVKIIPNANPVNCIPVVQRGSIPGTEVNTINFGPEFGVIVFKHIHSGSVPTDTTFNAVPVQNVGDSREADLYPPGLCVAPFTPNGLQGCLGVGAAQTPQPGQENLTTTGFGNIPPNNLGGSISLFYQFVVCNANHFTFVWHNTTGPLREGVGADPGLPSPAVGAHLFQIMEGLPQTDVEYGSIVSIGYRTNGVRDPILYQQHIRPQIYVPLHMTDVAVVSSSLEFKKAYIETMANSLATQVEGVNFQPEIRWMVDPNDYLRPMVFDPTDARWRNPDKDRRIAQASECGSSQGQQGQQ